MDHFSGLDTNVDVRKTDKQDSDKSVSDTIGLMVGHANRACKSNHIAVAVNESGANDPYISDVQKINRVFAYIRNKVRFAQDEEQLARLFEQPNSKELLITPEVLLSMAQPTGDCDDFSMLCCAMLQAVGVQCNFVTVAADSSMMDQYTHVYCMAVTQSGEQIPCDCSHGKFAGWETPQIYRKQVWPVINLTKDDNSMAGLGDWFSDMGIGKDYPTLPSASVGGVDWNSLLPGLFGSIEKIAIQTTQQPGYSQTGPNGQGTSVVLAPGQTNSGILNIPGTSAISGNNSTLLIVAGVVGLFIAVKAMSK